MRVAVVVLIAACGSPKSPGPPAPPDPVVEEAEAEVEADVPVCNRPTELVDVDLAGQTEGRVADAAMASLRAAFDAADTVGQAVEVDGGYAAPYHRCAAAGCAGGVAFTDGKAVTGQVAIDGLASAARPVSFEHTALADFDNDGISEIWVVYSPPPPAPTRLAIVDASSRSLQLDHPIGRCARWSLRAGPYDCNGGAQLVARCDDRRSHLIRPPRGAVYFDASG